ncbi:MAG: recombination mediator RecR [Eubacteriales bacterium]|nr:recombination mediator RecR [Christensenellaceae bacterium]MDY3241695.1 recombination mediator RecR [Eubacteriales bacterium]MCI7582968.1 recombination mediator RecR [Christensenellaceae bacterium]MCI7769532.1 recombination mediator RecR [Christensenellaceae bacterium]MDD6360373.1 recombination mediator RecR [Christensenellaceae bacterium]
MPYIEPLAKLIAEFTKFEGVGEKTAARYAYSILKRSDAEVEDLIEALRDVKQKVRFCKVCGNYTDGDVCDICKTRDKSVICVVKEPKDVQAFEKVKSYKGVYHVLHGVISPIEHVGPDDINIRGLLDRLDGVKEVIIATNPDVEGEATALYIARLIKPLGIKVTRIARGLPEGSVIEYADEMTLSTALRTRVEL